jgi:hypothetical protein
MPSELEVLASELPILDSKENFKYIEEVSGDGRYRQVAWQKIANNYIALYGQEELKVINNQSLEIDFPEEEA